MSRLPFVVRVAAGAVSLAAEKGQELVAGAVAAPLTLGSKSAQMFIRVQQDLAELAVRGDAAIDVIFPAKQDEQPAWATFDEDEDDDIELPTPTRAPYGEVRTAAVDSEASDTADTGISDTADTPASDPDDEQRPTAPGRYALYSQAPTIEADPAPASERAADELPPAVARIDYPELTLAQLRGRLPGLSTADLQALADFERSGRARAPFLTMLDNRLNR